MNLSKLYISIFFLFVGLQISAQTVYVTKTGKKYHRENCRYLKYSKKKIELKKARNFGFQACKVCKVSSAIA